jgi:hypothetical protein
MLLDINQLKKTLKEGVQKGVWVYYLASEGMGYGPPSPTPVVEIGEEANMTLARALFIKVMEQYVGMAYRLTLLEVQKLAYFLQEAGEPLKLKYDAGPYGPYAENLNKVLQAIEGHFTRGYGDSPKPDRDIELLPGAVEKAGVVLESHAASRARLEKVEELIEGFETPYGMELLSSVHWVAKHGEAPAADATSAVTAIHAWNDRKRNLFKAPHIQVAWERLQEAGWLN